MNTTDEYGQKLVELSERSAQSDRVVGKSRQAAEDVKQELDELRAKQRETTNILHKLEGTSSNAWENIGGGG